MRSFYLVSLALLLVFSQKLFAESTCQPNWESLNARPAPEWFGEAKFGIFIHWGVYSVPAYCDKSTYSEWYWHWLRTQSHNGKVSDFHKARYGEGFRYQDFAEDFKAELWEPVSWAKLFKRAGAKYVVLVSKHHDGFALWPNEAASSSRGYPWNSMQTGPKRDLCGELSDAVRDQGLRMGFYYSFMEWEHPLFETDKERYVSEYMMPQFKELIERYRPDIVWPDGEWNEPDTLWRSPELVAWLYNTAPNIDSLVINDRWGKALRGQVGDFYTTEYGNIGGGSPGLLENKPFEECRGIGHSFALNRLEDYDDYQTRESLIRMLIDLVSKGGNLLLNIGPAADGTIPVIMQDRLIAIGEWLEVKGDAIYGTRKSNLPDQPWGRVTEKGNKTYLHVFDWPEDHQLQVSGINADGIKKAFLLHGDDTDGLRIQSGENGKVAIDLLGHHPFAKAASVVVLER